MDVRIFLAFSAPLLVDVSSRCKATTLWKSVESVLVGGERGRDRHYEIDVKLAMNRTAWDAIAGVDGNDDEKWDNGGGALKVGLKMQSLVGDHPAKFD
jgi:hypothetical protein